MIDLVTLHIQAGKGGDGRVSFHREKYIQKGGPDGGIGGDGGSVIVRASSQMATLAHFSGVHEVLAESGQNGGRKKQRGAAGKSQVIEVPVGTVIWSKFENTVGQLRRLRHTMSETLKRGETTVFRYQLEEEGQFIPEHPHADILEKDDQIWSVPKKQKFSPEVLGLQKLAVLSEDGAEILLCQGGFGGRGNVQFKSSRQTTPLVAEHGTPGEDRVVVFELRLLADVGLVGYPNAGKSTLLSVLTEASPKIGAYPFTTLEPQLGVMKFKGKEIIIADIPGIIEGASEGKGLGFEFLRHIDNCSTLLYVVSFMDESVLNLSVEEQVKYLRNQFDTLRLEVKEYNSELLDKRSLIAITKKDLMSKELEREIAKAFKDVAKKSGKTSGSAKSTVSEKSGISKKIPLIQVSAATREGLDSLRAALL